MTTNSLSSYDTSGGRWMVPFGGQSLKLRNAQKRKDADKKGGPL